MAVKIHADLEGPYCLACYRLLSAPVLQPLHHWAPSRHPRGCSVSAAYAQNGTLAFYGMVAVLETGYMFPHIKVSWVLRGLLIFFLTRQILIAIVPIDQRSYRFWPFPGDSTRHLLSERALPCSGRPRRRKIREPLGHGIFLVLGIARTIMRPSNSGEMDMLGGYRVFWSFGIDFDGLGAVLSERCTFN